MASPASSAGDWGWMSGMCFVHCTVKMSSRQCLIKSGTIHISQNSNKCHLRPGIRKLNASARPAIYSSILTNKIDHGVNRTGDHRLAVGSSEKAKAIGLLHPG